MTKGIEEILGTYRLVYGLPDPRNGAAEFCKAALMHPIPPGLTKEDADAVQDLLALLDPQGTGAERVVEEHITEKTVAVVDVDVRGLDTAIKKMERLKRMSEEYVDYMKKVLKISRSMTDSSVKWMHVYKDTLAAVEAESRRQQKEGRRRQ